MLGQVVDAPVGQLLREAIHRLRVAGSELPRLDAELLIGHVTGLDRTAIVAHPERLMDAAAAGSFRAALGRRERGEPVAYIRGIKEFHGLRLHVDRRALIPRPETELLVDLAARLAMFRAARLVAPQTVRVVDVGTGSGAISIALAASMRERGLLERVTIVATDDSPAALELAAWNLDLHGLTGVVGLVEADLLLPGAGRFDLVLANLPYIPSGQIDALPVAASFEPRSALDGGPDGLAIIRRLLAVLPGNLARGGTALLEIGSDQEAALGEAVAELRLGWSWRVERDLSGLPRVAVVDRPA